MNAQPRDQRVHRPATVAANPMNRRSRGRWLAGVVLVAVMMPCAVSGAEAMQVEGPVVELPKFEVTDSRLLPPPESWHYAEIPGFEILSRISERETRRFVRDFLLLQEVIEAIMPVLLRGQTAVPTALVLCGGRGKGFDEFLPADQAEQRYGKNSLFLPRSSAFGGNETGRMPERFAIVIDFALSEIQLQDDTHIEADPYRAFYAEYFRFLIQKQLGGKAPPWFEEGLVQLFAATDFDKKTITFAQIGDGFGAEKIGDFNRMLHRRAIMPMGEMLKSEGPRDRSRFWQAQCYAFVHYCLYGWGLKNQGPFVKYVQRLSTEEPTEQLFKECFNKTYKQMALEIRGYVDFTAHKAMQFRAKKGDPGLPEPPAIVLRAAADHEVGRIKGEVLRLGGHSTEAHNALIAPYVRGERDPRLLAALGLDEITAGDNERARKFLEAAANGKVQRARAYLELARLRMSDARAKPAGPNGQLDGAQVTAVLTPLFTARKQRPPMPEVYSLIAETWSLAAARPEPEHLEVVIEGVRMFPRDGELLMQATLLAAKRGYPAEARALAELGMKISKDPGDQDRFRVIAAAFQRDTDPNAPLIVEPAPTVGPYFPPKTP